MKFKNLAILSIMSISLLTGCSDKEKIDQSAIVSNDTPIKQTPTKAHEAPSFRLKKANGETIEIIADVKNGWKFKGYEGKVILLDFFGTWCPPCKAEIPHLNNIREDMKNRFEIIGVDIGSRRGEVTPSNELASFVKEFKIKYPITTSGDNKKLYGALGELNPNGSIPFMILFDKKGVIVQYYVGMQREGILRDDIDKALKR